MYFTWIVQEITLLLEFMRDHLTLASWRRLWPNLSSDSVNLMQGAKDAASHLWSGVEYVRTYWNDSCTGLEPWQVSAYTLFLVAIIMWIYAILFDSNKPITTRIRKGAFRLARKLPWVQKKIAGELEIQKLAIQKSIHECDKLGQFHKSLPDHGYSVEDLLKEATEYRDMSHFDISKGQISGTAYACGEDLTDINAQVYKMFMWSNPLHPDVFPGVRKMEAEVVRMVCDMFHGNSDTCGNVTSGGTESLLLVCLAYRNRAYDLGITDPEMVIPITAHAAFDKAAELFNIRIKHIPVDTTGMVNLWSMKRAVSSNTCMLVASAPNFPYGTIDPVEEICKIASGRKIPVHVDSCLGGFLVPFMEEAGFEVKKLDFRIPGVTSISCDSHKYGFTPKGSSIIMYRNADLLHYQYFCQPDWPGGIYASPTLAGSRCGANIAVCWATLLYHGRDKYIESTKKIITTTRYIQNGLREMEGIDLMGQSDVSVIAFTSKIFNVYTVSDRMGAKGWNLNALQFPSSVHLAVTANTCRCGVADKFLSDMTEICVEMKHTPGDSADGQAAMYGMAQSIPDRSLVSELAHIFLDTCLSTDHPLYSNHNGTKKHN